MVAAKRMFLSRPYSQVSVEEIAVAADLSKATVYSYFQDKLDIYSAIILSDARDLADQIRAAAHPTRVLLDQLRTMARVYLKFFQAHPEYFETLSWFYYPGRSRHLSKRLVREVGQHFMAVPEAIRRCLEHGIRKGELRRVNAKLTATTIYSQWLGLTYLAVASPNMHPDWEGLVDGACELFLNGVASPRRLHSSR
jgi:AcrR family transcriptional regulator